MLAVALVLHGLGFFIVLPDLLSSNKKAAPEEIALFRPLLEAPVVESEIGRRSADPPPETELPEPEPAEDQVETDSAINRVDRRSTAPSSEPPSAQQLIQQTLREAEASVPMRPPERLIVEGKPVPRLPGKHGWLNNFVGVVRSSHDSWLEADGASSSQVVTASGEVFCGRRRAPTAAEEFNPWTSAALMLWKSCGRQRPEPIDEQDPWRRGRGVRP